MGNVRKMYHKGSTWARHGKWAGRKAWCCLRNRLAAQRREREKARKPKMYESVYDCLRANGVR